MTATGSRHSPQSCSIDVVREFPDSLTFIVTVAEGAGESRHRVTLSADDAERFSAHAPRRIVEAAMMFLLDREPKESILGAFDIGVIRRYFPDFDRAFSDYLARMADS